MPLKEESPTLEESFTRQKMPSECKADLTDKRTRYLVFLKVKKIPDS